MSSISWCRAGVTVRPPGGFFRKLLKGLKYTPRGLITDKLESDAAAKRDVMPGVEYGSHKGLSNRTGASHPPTRQKARQMRRFKSPGQAQRFSIGPWPRQQPLPPAA